MPTFDADIFRRQHSPDLAEPLASGGQLPLDRTRHRVIVRTADNRVAYDSQREHGDAGLFGDRAEALEHGMCWIEFTVQFHQRREALEQDRRFRLADVEAASQKREADLRAQRTDLTKSINRERKIQAALAAEARDPQVSMEFLGGCRWQVVDEPSVFDGTLDAEGRELPRPARSRPRDEDAGAGPTPPPASSDPVEQTLAEVEVDADAELADTYRNGNATAEQIVERIEWIEREGAALLPSTLLALVLGDTGRKRRRPTLDAELDERLPPGLDRAEALDPPELRHAMAEAAACTVEQAIAAAAYLTSTSESTRDLVGWAEQIADASVLGHMLHREQQRPKPRKRVISTIEARAAELGITVTA